MKHPRNRIVPVRRRRGNRPDPVMQAASQHRSSVVTAERLVDRLGDPPRDSSGQLLMFADAPAARPPCHGLDLETAALERDIRDTLGSA